MKGDSTMADNTKVVNNTSVIDNAKLMDNNKQSISNVLARRDHGVGPKKQKILKILKYEPLSHFLYPTLSMDLKFSVCFVFIFHNI